MIDALFLGSKSLGHAVIGELVKADCPVKWRVIHPGDQADGRSLHPLFADFARRSDLDLSFAASLKAARELIRNCKPDIAFACGWYWLLDAVGGQVIDFYEVYSVHP